MGANPAGGNLALDREQHASDRARWSSDMIFDLYPARTYPPSARFCAPARTVVAGIDRLRRRTTRRGDCGRMGGASDVRSPCVADFNSRPHRTVPVDVRKRGDVRASAHDLRLRGAGPGGRALCGRPLHYRGLLVHGVHVFRQSGGHDRARSLRHFRGHSAFERRGFHPCPADRNGRGACAASVALASRRFRIGLESAASRRTSIHRSPSGEMESRKSSRVDNPPCIRLARKCQSKTPSGRVRRKVYAGAEGATAPETLRQRTAGVMTLWKAARAVHLAFAHRRG